jgi:hypothetical protein
MEQWEYDISVHTAGEVAVGAKVAPDPERVLFCGVEGECFFDAAPNPYLKSITTLLNTRGREGWILVQTVLREQDMICFWRRALSR